MVMKGDSSTSDGFTPGRRLAIGFRVLVSCALMLAILVMINLVAARHPLRTDIAARDRFHLAPLSLRVLETLTNDVKVSVIFSGKHDLYGYVESLLRRYEEASPRVRVERVDYDFAPARAAALKEKYNLSRDESDVVVFDGGRVVKKVYGRELSDYRNDDVSELAKGRRKDIRRAAFKGETMFTSALISLNDAKRVRVGFLTGHGEHDLKNDDSLGYRRFVELLAEKGVDAEALDITAVPAQIHPDIQLIIIAGPTRTVSAEEIAKLDGFLQNGGRMLVLFNRATLETATGLEIWLQRWGIVARGSLVVDDKQSAGRGDLLVTHFGAHPVTTPLSRAQERLQLWTPRFIGRMPDSAMPADAPKVEYLLLSSEAGETRSKIREGVAYAVAGLDTRGSIPVAAAAERGSLTGVTSGTGATRIIVAGDSDFLANDPIRVVSGNRRFALLAIDWLLDRSQFLAVAPKPLHEFSIRLSERQMLLSRWTFLGLLPGAVLTLGLLVWLRRRS